MPLYEYRCEDCGQTFEVMQKFSDAPLTVHEGCGGPVQRLISPPALQFKGSGWYITDYAKGGSTPDKNAGSSENGAPKKTDAPAAASSGSESTSTPAPAKAPSPEKKTSSSDTK